MGMKVGLSECMLISKILMPVLSTSHYAPCSLAASETSNIACLFREPSHGTRGQMAEALNPTACNALFSLFIERRGAPRTKQKEHQRKGWDLNLGRKADPSCW